MIRFLCNVIFAGGFCFAGFVLRDILRERRSLKRRRKLEEKFQRDVEELNQSLEYLARAGAEFDAADPDLGISDEDIHQAMEDLRK